MQCRIEGCPGEYEVRGILHLMGRRADPVVVAHVPAEVCSLCGDTLFGPDTVRQLEALRQCPPEPVGTLPLYEFGDIEQSQRANDGMRGQAVAD